MALGEYRKVNKMCLSKGCLNRLHIDQWLSWNSQSLFFPSIDLLAHMQALLTPGYLFLIPWHITCLMGDTLQPLEDSILDLAIQQICFHPLCSSLT